MISSRSRFAPKWLKIAFVVAMVVAGINAVVPYVNLTQMARMRAAIDPHTRTDRALEKLLSGVTDAETGQRGFVVTGNEAYLEPYHAGIVTAREQVKELQRLTGAGLAQLKSMPAIESGVREKMRVMAETISVRRAKGFEAAARILSTDVGKRAMDRLRGLIGEARSLEQQRLQQLQDTQARKNRQTLTWLALTTGINIVLFGAIFYFVFKILRERARAESDSAHAASKLRAMVGELEKRNDEIALLGKMGDALQSCPNEKELFQTIEKFSPQLLPGYAGAVYMFHASRDLLEAEASWGMPAALRDTFEPDGCWAMRRGSLHRMDNPAQDLVCPHLAHALENLDGTLCLPMMAQGESLGVIYLEQQPSAASLTPAQRAVSEQLAIALAEQIALALSNMRLRETLRKQSIVDPLTGLYNRRFLDETLRREVVRAQRKGKSIATLILDVDHFKRFNDTFGHEAGDLILRTLAQELGRHVRESDIACRYGGEEFVIIMPEADVRLAAERANQLREAVRRMNVRYGGQPLGQITISVGVAGFPDHATDADALIQAADAALYAAKHSGRNQVIVSGTNPVERERLAPPQAETPKLRAAKQ